METKKFLTWLAGFFTAADIVAYAALRHWGWEKSADFDIIGFMWVLTNIPRLVLWLCFYGSVAFTGYLWIMAAITPRDADPV